MQYVKIINGELEFAPVNKGSIFNYNLDVKQMLKDGYKPFEEIEKPITERIYEVLYIENSDKISEIINYIESEEEYQNRKNIEKIQAEIDSIMESIKELDFRRIRALCEPTIKDEETGETWLDYYNSQILELREQLKILKERII